MGLQESSRMGTITTMNTIDNILDFMYYTPKWYVIDFIYEVKMKFQLFSKGYNERMVYSFCDYMTDLNLKLLKDLKKTKHGFPSQLTEKKWDKILGQMIEGFEAQVTSRDVFTVKEYNKLDKKFKDGMKLYVEYYNNLWD